MEESRPTKKIRATLGVLLQERENALNICQTSLATITAALETANTTIKQLTQRVNHLEKENKQLKAGHSRKQKSVQIAQSAGTSKATMLDLQVDGSMINALLNSLLHGTNAPAKRGQVEKWLFSILDDKSLPELASFLAHQMMGKPQKSEEQSRKKVPSNQEKEE